MYNINPPFNYQSDRKVQLLALFLILLALLGGCQSAQAQPDPASFPTPMPSVAPGVTPDVTPSATLPPLTDEGNGCLPVYGDLTLFSNPAQGYCLLLPPGFEAKENETGHWVVLGPASTPGHRERLFLDVRDGMGLSLEDAAGQILMNYSLPAGEIEQTDVEVGGQPGLLIGKLPGQEINQRLLIIHNGRLYDLTLLPADPEAGLPYVEMDALYAYVLDTFVFLND
ncbi:MAG: hypothetical protein WBO46_04400 [Caldilineaceae bacterium]